MALIKCYNCGGVVSTKAAACPHCENKEFKMAEHKADKIEALADELGSISAAISEEYDKQPTPVTPATATNAQEETLTSSYSMGGFILFSLIVVGIVWYHFGLRLAGPTAAALGMIRQYVSLPRSAHSVKPQAQPTTIGDNPK